MRSPRATITAVLLLIAAAVGPARAQQSQEPKPKPKQGQDDRGERGKPEAKPTPRGLQSKEPQEERRQDDDRNRGEAWRRHRAHEWRSEHQRWSQRGGYDGFRIPPDRFRPAFGREHWFRIHNMPMVIVGGWPRFQYGGYWFRLVDPWPESWADNWYMNDDVSIDYVDDGYYLYNRRYPDTPLAVRVYLK
jgi:hypothetical protein